jgi:hypothetical protein
MQLAILLSLAASLCTATASVCQRLGARRATDGEMRGFDPLLVFRLARQPAWLLGFASLLAGFGFQITALRFGPLAAAQPGFTTGDPVTAILLGTFLFGEHLGTSPAALAAEVLGLLVFALGVRTLSRSELITGPPPWPAAVPGEEPAAHR